MLNLIISIGLYDFLQSALDFLLCATDITACIFQLSDFKAHACFSWQSHLWEHSKLSLEREELLLSKLWVNLAATQLNEPLWTCYYSDDHQIVEKVSHWFLKLLL